ncbi:MAG: endonuclease domain-containing protein, partial [Flavobacteriales bacterium]
CNLALGRFNDDEKLLRKAIDYLNKGVKVTEDQ